METKSAQVDYEELSRRWLPLPQTVWSMTQEQPHPSGRRLALASDIEGPLVLGDLVLEALAEAVRPAGSDPGKTPPYGALIYRASYDVFNQMTGATDKHLLGRTHGTKPSLQEGADTILALPWLLACGVDSASLALRARRAMPSPGILALTQAMDGWGICLRGITTAPGSPYREALQDIGIAVGTRVSGSMFPLDEIHDALIAADRWEVEMGAVKRFLSDACDLIDTHVVQTSTPGPKQPALSVDGKASLMERIVTHYRDDLGLSWMPGCTQGSGSLLGQLLTRCFVIGDRAKAALALAFGRSIKRQHPGCRLVAMGDGLNDAYMLRHAPVSFGINGAHAACAAKIGVITRNMACMAPVLQDLARGESDLDRIIGRANAQARGEAFFHRGGMAVPAALLEQHDAMKAHLRGSHVTY
ncbi:hypothetical protein [Dyella choica]|uniref:Uncharacterized protein n=1 Tax=Dyella choica TaxID=1927959 RepID=A0A3S0WSY8_9GAMM|nr:hypothetical protein [Dyella choica]RUL70195.1 hypothetical protein EKH80_21125 [Dyella choica]